MIAAGAIPVGIWGGMGSVSQGRAYLQPFACSIMQSIMELQLSGTYDVLDAVMIPSNCDTLKCMGQKWKGKCPAIQFTHPQNRVLEASCVFLAEEYEYVAGRLEEILSVKISEQALEQAIAVCNQNRIAMQRFVKAAAEHPRMITPSLRHDVFKSRFFMEREDHTRLVEELVQHLEEAPAEPWDGVRVILTGITCEPVELLEIMEGLNIAVAGDDLAQESRQIRTLVPESGEPALMRLARMWQNIEGCSLAGDVKKYHGPMLIKMLQDSKADAVIVCMMKFCDPEEFDYGVYNTQFARAGVRHVMIDIDQEVSGFEQIRTRLQSFVEMQ